MQAITKRSITTNANPPIAAPMMVPDDEEVVPPQVSEIKLTQLNQYFLALRL